MGIGAASRAVRRAGVALCMPVLLAGAAVAQENPTEAPYTYRAIVKDIVDGETVDVDIDLGFYIWAHGQRIRLLGVDAPEPDDGAADEAAEWLKERIGGKTVILKSIVGEDSPDRRTSFGNWLGIFYLDGVNINEEMVEAGHAVAAGTP